ncbi:hypothetical protein PCH_Pc13g01110 [Penicillium rubens Wisconsin 54-1255]|uniref:Uncharacterized protein n=1 Tax=Penicillium rubens (strain ATCC 28089 / DSM 1075 / NRRL 1951 / Wisconsin 54-1255) TaxID=500485 RepID=B6H1L9_PENRW|nr:hypothetical protein PCH_Pc13g01110 [Penicillium rubens Wisconsin 54-1255]
MTAERRKLACICYVADDWRKLESTAVRTISFHRLGEMPCCEPIMSGHGLPDQPLTRIFVPDPGRFGLKRKGSVTPIGYRLKHLARCCISDKGPQPVYVRPAILASPHIYGRDRASPMENTGIFDHRDASTY